MGFCIKCGAPVQDGEQFCANCNNVGGTGNVNPGKGNDFMSKIKDNKKLIPIIAGAAALVVVVILVIAIVVGVSLSGPNRVIKKSTSWVKNGATFDKKDAEKLVSKYAGNEYMSELRMKALEIRYNSDYTDDDYDDYLDDLAEEIEEEFDDLEDEYGDDWKLTYEIKKKEALDEDELEDMNDYWENYVDGLEDMADGYADEAKWADDDDAEEMYEQLSELYEKYADKYGKYKVTKGYHYKVSVRIEGEDDKNRDTIEFNVVKINGKWVFIDENPILDCIF